MIFCVLRWTWSFVFIFVFVLVFIYVLCFCAATHFSVNKELYNQSITRPPPLTRPPGHKPSARQIRDGVRIVRSPRRVPCTQRINAVSAVVSTKLPHASCQLHVSYIRIVLRAETIRKRRVGGGCGTPGEADVGNDRYLFSMSMNLENRQQLSDVQFTLRVSTVI